MPLLTDLYKIIKSYDFEIAHNDNDKVLGIYSTFNHEDEKHYIEVYRQTETFFTLHLYGFHKGSIPHVIDISNASDCLELEQYLENNL